MTESSPSQDPTSLPPRADEPSEPTPTTQPPTTQPPTTQPPTTHAGFDAGQKLSSLATAWHLLVRRLRDPAQPMPPAILVGVAVLALSIALLSLRLSWTAQQPRVQAPPSTTAQSVAPPSNTAAPTATAVPAPADEAAVRATVESWREAWQGKDLERYLSHYASTFGAQGRDRQGWADQKAAVFAAATPIEVELGEAQITFKPAIAIVSFVQSYRSGDYQDRGRKRLYLLQEAGNWRISNEEWEPVE